MNVTELRGQLVAERYSNVDHNDPRNWWSDDEVSRHRAALAHAIGYEIGGVAALIEQHRRDKTVDWVAVERVCEGEWYPLNRAEKVEAFRWMRGHGYPVRVIQQRLRVSGTALNKLAKEAS